MESRAFALITGLFVLGVAACIGLWAHWLANKPQARTPYRVVATVPVSGLNPEAQVRYRGMGVGRVSSLGLDPKDPRRILIRIEVDEGIPVTKGTYAQLGMEGITGIAYVHLLDDYGNMEPAAKTADGITEIALRPSLFDTLSDNAEGVLRDARLLVTNLNDLLTPENKKRISSIVASLDKVSADLQMMSARLPVIAGRAEAWLSEDNRRLARDSLQGISDAAKSLPELSKEAQQLVKDARVLVENVNKLTAEVHGTAGGLRNETLPRVNALAESVERSAQRVGRLALQLDREPQSAIWGRQKVRPGPGEQGFE